MTPMLKYIFIALLSASLPFSSVAHAGPTIQDLSWMTGAWAGPVGPGVTLEENWIEATDGSIASLVRITGHGSTSMVELIVIEEENDSLVLRVKQWDAGFSPRTEKPQTMTLVKVEENRVEFKQTDAVGFKTLAYSRPTPDTFIIELVTAAGDPVQIPLQAR
jgi:hypothetical protein